MSHTPGPWKQFDGWGSDSRKPIIVDSTPDVGGQCVANCICYVAASNDDFAANARLIAAAPELLQALKNLCEAVQFVAPGVYCLDEMKAAISKAEGATL